MSDVSILPQGATLDAMDNITEEIVQPSKTYKIKDGRIVGLCYGIEALKQAIYFILNTERYEYVIYSWDYGSELKEVLLMEKEIAESELKRRIKEALIQDDRVNNVDNFIFNYGKDSVTIQFTVFSIYGDFTREKVI